MSGTWFISDLHLDDCESPATRQLQAFLAHITGSEALYILGDLFEYWPGDDNNTALADLIREAFQHFTATATPLILMHGNRDFLLGNEFCRETGATLIDDPTMINLYGTAVLLTHGDLLCTADRDYQALRETVRSTRWQEDLLQKPLVERISLARAMRKHSAEAKSNKAAEITDVDPATIDEVMTRWGVRELIHGHTHRPGRYATSHGQRWVLGDWECGEGELLHVTHEEWRLHKISEILDGYY